MKIGKIFRRNQQQEEEMAKPKKFEVIQGGKAQLETGGKEPPSSDWLTPLGDNTVFLGRQKRVSDPILSEFTIVKHSQNAIQMRINDQMVWFDPGRFCAATDLVDILHYGSTDE